MEIFLDPNTYISLLTLSVLEIILGIDNIIVIAILVNKLPQAQRGKARFIGLGLAMVARILLLLTLAWISHLIQPLFTLGSFPVTGRDLVLFFGGLFLIYKAGAELWEHVSLAEFHHAKEKEQGKQVKAAFGMILLQIIALDIVFSLDSVITAIGIANQIPVMIAAIIIAIAVMMLFARPIAEFIERFPALKVLALTFLVLVGVVLVVDGLHYHIEKAYIYSAMGFSLAVAALNIVYETRVAKFKAAHPEVYEKLLAEKEEAAKAADEE